MKKGISILLLTTLLFSIMVQTVLATNATPEIYYQTATTTVLNGIQKNEYHNSNGQVMYQYNNIDTYVANNLSKRNLDQSAYELAKSIMTEIEGDSVEHLPTEYIMDALTYTDVTQMVSYIKVKADGTQVYMSKDAMMDEIMALHENNSEYAVAPMSFDGDFVSEDGYMELTTTISQMITPSYCTDSRNKYYIISVISNWLIEPVQKFEDMLAFSYTPAIYNNHYTDYAYIVETAHCSECGKYYSVLNHSTTYSESGVSYSDSAASNHINIVYNQGGGGLSCHVNFVANPSSYTCYHTVNGISQDCVEITRMESSLRTCVYSQGNDFSTAVGYAHKWLSVGSISASFGIGTLGFSASVVTKYTEYFARPVTVTYNT
ncbi:MAG: hypothetical protein J6D19_01690 [Clostridia bacterium]|nr:hypothetical protein [Clostridia bacterium]